MQHITPMMDAPLTSATQEMKHLRILFLITFLHNDERSGYLLTQFLNAASWSAGHVDCIVLTETDVPAHLAAIERLAEKVRSPDLTITISSHPDMAARPRLLPWKHKDILCDIFPHNRQGYTHCIHTQDDMAITEKTLRYFITHKAMLAPYGLLPDFIRYEYNHQERDVFSIDQQGQQCLSYRSRVMAGGHEWLALNVPYTGMFILDEKDIAEYLASSSSDLAASESVTHWGEPERAFMGLTWENKPEFFPSRCVVPLKIGTHMPDPSCWVHHLPDSYTNDYTDTPNYVLGKTRMDALFSDEGTPFQGWRFASALMQGKGECAITILAELYPAASYSRNIPPLFGEADFIAHLTESYDNLCKTENRVQPSYISILEDAFALGSVLYTHSHGKTSVILETYRANDLPYVKAFPPGQLSQQEIHYETGTLGEISFFLGSAGSGNYGHWLTDDLPRLEALLVLHEHDPVRHIQILLDSFSPQLDRIKEESIRRYVAPITNISIRFLDSEICYSFPKLYYASPVSYHPTLKSPRALERTYRRIVGNPPPGPGKRLFVSRCPPDRRSLSNHDEIETLLSSWGFETFIIDEPSFDEQVSLFANADIIVGCMGAAMSNMLFAPAGAQIIMLAPEGWVEPYYWDLADVRGLHYTALYGPLDSPLASPVDSSYTIPAETLRQIITPML